MLLALRWASPRCDRIRMLWPLAAIAAAAILGFAWLSNAVIERDDITAIDGPTATWFAQHRTLFEGQLGLLVAKATSPGVLIAAVVVTAFICHRRGRSLEAVVLIAATGLAYLTGAIAKYTLHRPRPVAPINLAPDSEPSYPSGHVLVITTVALVGLALAWRYLDRRRRILAAIITAVAIVLVSLDRLVVGAHWLTDVAGSLALATIITTITVGAYRILQQRRTSVVPH